MNWQRRDLNLRLETRILFGFIKILPATVAMVYLHSFTAKHSYFAFGYESQTAAFVTSYYISILLHEWGHGTVAWLYGLKSSPFDVTYGSWALLPNIDEHVNYASLLAASRGVAAALIGIAGFTVSLLLLISPPVK